ncbi:MAG: DUF3667 domain-containing protein [Alphaproteobacteria bacterium]|nr:DUF3667 domain-containing protein [Alphaproteobacteria bacterium]
MGSDLDGLVDMAGAVVAEAAALTHAAHREFCGNCGTKFTGQFCSDCGQERDTHRRSLIGLLHDLIEDVLSFDSRILRTAGALVLRPGELSCAFREGRLRRYVPPIRLYFFATLLFFLTLSVTGIALMRLEIVDHPIPPGMSAKIAARMATIEGKPGPKLNKLQDGSARHTISLTLPGAGKGSSNIYIADSTGKVLLPALRTQFFVPKGGPAPKLSAQTKQFLVSARERLKREQIQMEAKKSGWGIGDWVFSHMQNATVVLEHNPDAVNGPLMNWIPRALFLLLPTFALLLALFYIGSRQDFYFVDHLVFSLNLHSFAFVVLILVAILATFGISAQLGWVALAVIGIYMLLAMKRFYGQGWVKTSVKFAFVSFIYFFIILIPALFMVVMVSALES